MAEPGKITAYWGAIAYLVFLFPSNSIDIIQRDPTNVEKIRRIFG
jgi:hypothetical protein